MSKGLNPGVVVTPTWVDSIPQQEFDGTVGALLVETDVKRALKRTMYNMLRPVNLQRLEAALHGTLKTLESQGVLLGFNNLEVTAVTPKPLQEVDCLPITAQPGDALVKNVAAPDGSEAEEYRGLIVSVDGQGNGIVLQRPTADSLTEVIVKVSVRSPRPVESIAIEVSHYV